MKIGVLLSGCGVYDGAEIQESVLTLLAIQEVNAEYVCISVDKNTHHVINHLDGSEMNESRNMLVEAARIARGNIKNIKEITPADIDALVIPGGFGNAKNFTKWAFEGPQTTILDEVKLLIVNMINVGKPIVSLCVSPVVIAKALEGSNLHPKLTLGSSQAPSEYDINAFHAGIQSIGATTEERKINEFTYDENLKIISAPCYMMEGNILDLRNNIKQAIDKLVEIL